jgi:hypothetical protein
MFFVSFIHPFTPFCVLVFYCLFRFSIWFLLPFLFPLLFHLCFVSVFRLMGIICKLPPTSLGLKGLVVVVALNLLSYLSMQVLSIKDATP